MRNRPLLSLCLVILTAVTLSVVCGGEKYIRELRPSPLEKNVPPGGSVMICGQIYRAETGSDYQTLYLCSNSIQYQEDIFQESKIILYTDSEEQFHIGNKVEARGEVSFYQDARNPGNFDQKRYYQIQDIHGMMWGEEIRIADAGIWRWRDRLAALRRYWGEVLKDALGEEDGAAMGAMLLGEKSGMDSELKTLYQVNGIGHVLAISGLHLSFIGIGMYKILRRVTGSYPVGGVFGILFLMLYILMIGFTVSAVRALVMFLFRVGADIAGRHYDAPTALSAAAVVVLLWRPLSLYDGGFWLSFGAVLAILSVVPVVQESISVHILRSNRQKIKMKTKVIVQDDISVYASCSTNVLHSGPVQMPDNRKEGTQSCQGQNRKGETQSCQGQNRKGETQSCPGQNRKDGFLSEYLMGVWGHVWQIIIQGLTASVGINLVILPILLYYFFEFPLYSFILNLFVIPLMSVLLFLGMTGSLFAMWLVPVSALLFWICSKILWIYKMSCEITLHLPGARLVIGRPEIWQIVVYYGILFLGLILLRYIASMKEQDKEEEERSQGYQRYGKDWRSKQSDRADKSISFNNRKSEKTGRSAWKEWPVVFLWAVGVMILMTRFGESGKLTTAILDVGQGDGIFMKGPEGGTYLVDGGSSDVKKVGQYRLESFLKSQGVGTLDYVLISHGDSDHMNGVEELIERQDIGVKIRTLVLPVQEVWDEALTGLAKKARDYGIRVVVIEAGQSIREGEMAVTCIQPGNTGIKSEDAGSRQENTVPETGSIIPVTAKLEPGNGSSMVLAVRYGQFDMLLTGDTEGEGEKQLTKRLEASYQDCMWEILKVAHHGSKNSSTEEFLRLVQPTYALVSAGQENRYGHPHQETLERLTDVGSKVYSTQENGAIIVEVEDGGLLRMEKWHR